MNSKLSILEFKNIEELSDCLSNFDDSELVALYEETNKFDQTYYDYFKTQYEKLMIDYPSYDDVKTFKVSHDALVLIRNFVSNISKPFSDGFDNDPFISAQECDDMKGYLLSRYECYNKYLHELTDVLNDNKCNNKQFYINDYIIFIDYVLYNVFKDAKYNPKFPQIFGLHDSRIEKIERQYNGGHVAVMEIGSLIVDDFLDKSNKIFDLYSNYFDSVYEEEDDQEVIVENGFTIDKISMTLLKYQGESDTVVIPEEIRIIGQNCFEKNTNLKKVVFNKKLTSIEQGAFNRCSNLTELIGLEDTSVSEIGKYSFKLTKVETFNLPATLETIGDEAFKDNSNLKDVYLNSYLNEIGEQIICKTNAVIHINDSLSYDDSKVNPTNYEIINNIIVNRKTNRLVTVLDTTQEYYIIPEGIRSIPRGFFLGSPKLMSVSLPQGLVYIHKECFKQCTHLKLLSLPASLCFIGESAFEDCILLKELTIPYNVQYIGKYTFSNCLGLNVLKVENRNIKISRDAFDEPEYATVFYAGTEKIDCYQNFEPFVNNIELSDEEEFLYCSYDSRDEWRTNE